MTGKTIFKSLDCECWIANQLVARKTQLQITMFAFAKWMEMSSERQRIEDEFKNLGLGTPVFDSDENAPNVDQLVLNRYLQGSLGEQAAELVKQLVAKYESWNKAYADLLLQSLEEKSE